MNQIPRFKIIIIQSSRMTWARLVAQKCIQNIACKRVGKLRRDMLEELAVGHRSEYYIKAAPIEIGWKGEDWIDLAQNRLQ
jgi:hypothetical protein